MNRKMQIIFAVIALLFVIALLLPVGKDNLDERSGEAFLPTLQDKLNQVVAVKISHQGEAFTLIKKDNAWVLEDNLYPADFGKIRELLIGFYELSILESKTTRTENYSKLGVDDPAKGNDTAKLVTAMADDGSELFSVIVGRAQFGAVPSLYARKKGEKQSWLLKGKINITTTKADWLEKTVADIKPDDVQQVFIKHPGKKPLIIHKDKAEDKEYKLVNVSKGVELKSQQEAGLITRALQNLQFEDVRAVDRQPIDQAKAVQSRFDLFNHTRIEMLVQKDEDAYWVSLQAMNMPNMEIDASRQQEIDKLNKTWQGWTYKLAAYKGDVLVKTLKDVKK